MNANGSRILVVGGAGFIGSALLPRLLDKGYSVRLIDLLLFGEAPIARVAGHPNLELIREDFRRENVVTAAMDGVDAVIHLGGIVGDLACSLDERLTTEVNVLATEMIAEAAARAGVPRLLFASSCSVYGAGDHLLNEYSPVNPISLYGETKVACEQILRRLAGPRFAPVHLRLGTTYGLSGRTRFDLVVNLFTAKALLEQRITVFGGNQWRPFLHVNDAALALQLALEAPKDQVANQVFNVGSDAQNFTIQQAAEAVQRLVPTAELVVEDAGTDKRNYRVSFAKIRDTLGFLPEWTLNQGIVQVRQSIQRGEVADYLDARYNNAKFLAEEGQKYFRPLSTEACPKSKPAGIGVTG